MSELIGRDDEISFIKSYINEMKSFHIYGPEGAGKTAVLEYIYQNWASMNTSLIPIFCRTSRTLKEILLHIAGFLLQRSRGLENIDKFGKIKEICRVSDLKAANSRDLKALVLCDGNMLNQDFDFYLSIVGERTKQIGLGTYKDGFNRHRPMLVFANPLGTKEMDRKITLIHPDKSLHENYKSLSLSNILQRSISEGKFSEFYCYRFDKDVQTDWKVFTLVDPFPVPERETKTQPRGKFRFDFRLTD